ncbi:MAG: methyltransferase family protein [Gemmatimonadaceae bacterium]
MILLPGVVAGYVPWRYFGVGAATFAPFGAAQLAGLALIVTGATLLGTCVWEFAHSGRGTLSPIDPPRRLVVRGLYRYVRNPMYLAVTTILLGEATAARSRELLVYWVVFFAVVNVAILVHEEPHLRHRFGASYVEYCANVGRWIPRLRPPKA